MNDNIVKNKGERLTFFHIFNEKKWKIEIPIIQRDYAQGRGSSQEIRENFLNTIYDHLESGVNIDLDFIYGSLSELSDTLFIPLDGQQRLTTLFLLHWYLANKEGEKQIFNESLVKNGKSNFTYETRTSSREFCDALVNGNFNIANLLLPDDKLANSLSKTIRDSAWYFSSWDNDPTIQSMLTMLDGIHEKFQNSVGYFDKLIDVNNQIITFQFLNLEEFKLTDDLYIKMNARGKQLTPFENFKAKFEQFIKNSKFDPEKHYKLTYEAVEKEVTVYEYFSHKIDTDWANLFWNYKDEKTHLFDIQLMNFIRVVATNHFALKEKNDEKYENLRLLIGKDDPESRDPETKPITFLRYKEIGCLDNKIIIDLISIFDFLTNGDDKIKKYLTESFYYDEEEIYNNVINNNLKYAQRIQFFAFYQFLNFNNTSKGLLEWIRVIHNLSENTIYNRPEEYARSIKSIGSLLPHSSNILDYLTDYSKDIGGFLDIQITEEKIKATLIQKSVDWGKTILKIEKHGYFSGQIGFILKFAGIEEYFNNNKNCNWSLIEDKTFIDSFNNYSEKASSVFDNNRLIHFDDFAWERVLLSKGNYLLKEGSNHSFLIDNDRDISWKRLLRDDNSDKRQFVKQVFDDANFDINDVENSLNSIIKAAKIQDWRKHFIELPILFKYLGFKRYIRWEDNGYKIYLLQKERMSGMHAEYYSYAFYIKQLEQNKTAFAPFKNTWYYAVSGDAELPCASIDEWKYKGSSYSIDIKYILDKRQYEIRFFVRDGGKYHKEILNVIQLMDKTDRYDDDSYLIMCNETELIGKIKELCIDLQRI